MEDGVVSSVHSTVFKESESLEGKCEKIKGYDFNQGVNYPKLLRSMLTTGFQASNLGEAIDVVNQMLEWRLADETIIAEDCSEKKRCKIFLGFTSNRVSSGVRDMICHLIQHHMVDVIVTTANSVEEDLIKCLAPTFKELKVINLFKEIEADKYGMFQDWINPIFDEMLKEQKEEKVLWTPSKLLARLGKEINNESSYLYWAYKMNIPVFCPAITDGSLGNMLYSHTLRTSGLIIDVVQDIKAINDEAVHATPRKTGMIILGGGVPKHHICNANNGADYAVFIDTEQEIDESDSSAHLDEAMSWGKIKRSSKTVKVHCDATIAFPLLVAETFAKMKDHQGVNYTKVLRSILTTGFQASNLGRVIDVVNQMLDWRLADETIIPEDCSEEEKDLSYRESVKCKIFLSFTSNLVSSGVRDILRYLVQHHMVDVIVTTAGGAEEDIIKCLAPTFKGDFSLQGAYLRSKGMNRIGNLVVPNDNYCKFEEWINPILDEMLKEQNEENVLWTPSKVLARLGKEINNESSYLYWAYKMNIPVFCPGLTDGSLGDMLYFHCFRTCGLIIDIVQDIKAINGEAVHATPRKTGMIILGGGLPKHHICNANMMRNGADYAVYINTGQEFDGSDSGASPDEAVSWGKIKASAKSVKVCCDATIAFPLLVAETFASKRDQTCEPKMN